MDADRIDAIAKVLISETSRRRTLGGLLGGTLGLLGLTEREHARARSGKCKLTCAECATCKKGRCRKTKHGKRCKNGKCLPKTDGTACTGGGSCQGGICAAAPVPPPFCAGKNFCDVGTVSCNTSGSSPGCICWVTVAGEPFCGGPAAVKPCAACTGEEVCVDLTGTGCGEQTGCVAPCAAPR